MNPRFLDWIWHIKGSLILPPEQSSEEAFAKLDPLFRQTGTSHHLTRDTLTFRKKGQAPQDKMSIFDDGVLRIEAGAAGPVLHYHLTSRALLYCFLAPLLFLGFAQLAVAIGNLETSEAEAASKSEEEDEAQLALHPIDAALGAPAPEKPEEKSDKKSEEEEDKPSPTPAYVFAALFALLYGVGRILEAWLIKSLFRKRLWGSEPQKDGAGATPNRSPART